jgi:drug/metabolite transporter (DMT)-like permease
MTMIKGAAYGLTAAAIWGAMYVVSDVVLETIPPFTLLAIRLLMGAAVLATIAWQTGSLALLPGWRDTLLALLVGMIGFGISVGAQFVGTDKSTAVNGALITSASPAFIALFAALILGERMAFRGMGAVALASVGVLFLLNLGQVDFTSQAFLGNVVLAVAAITWGLYSVLVRHISARMDTMLLTLLGFMGGLVLIIPAALIETQTRHIGELTHGVILGVLFLGVISTAVAMWLWNRAFTLVEASIASLFFFAQPVVGALLSVIFLHQQITGNMWIGSGLIGLGVLLALVPAHWLAPMRRQILS